MGSQTRLTRGCGYQSAVVYRDVSRDQNSKILSIKQTINKFWFDYLRPAHYFRDLTSGFPRG
jgi:hypothetical protein